jgi:heme/copper-type cytochrome/quinol oxidase subunit 1
MTIGFILGVMFGVAQRVLPVFNGVNLHSSRAMRVTFWLFAAGSTVAVAMAFASVYETAWAFAWAGAAGTLVLAAVGVFAWNITMTLLATAEKFTRESEVKASTRVADILDVWPDLRPVLIHGGLSGLAALRHNPPRFVTLDLAARRHGLDPQRLIDLLNTEIQRKRNA